MVHVCTEHLPEVVVVYGERNECPLCQAEQIVSDAALEIHNLKMRTDRLVQGYDELKRRLANENTGI